MSKKPRTKAQPASRQSPAKLDVSDNDTAWPSEIPDQLRIHLEDKVGFIKDIFTSRKERASPTLMRDDAKALRTAANSLLKKFRKFSDSYQITIVENYRRQAEDRLLGQFPVISNDKLDLCRMGIDPYKLQWPLFGLMAYADELADTDSGNNGRPKADLEHRAVAEILRCFKYIAFEPQIDEGAVLLRTCQAFLARADKPKSSETVLGYIRTVKSETWEKFLKFSP